MERIKEESECCFCSGKENLVSMLEPYENDEKFEIYSNMIAECFQIELNLYIQEFYRNLCLMCTDCVFRLREAVKFRSQIQTVYNHLQDLISRRIECSDVDTKDNLLSFDIRKCDNMGVDSVTSFPDEDPLESNSLSMVEEKFDINKMGDITTASLERFKDDASLHSAVKSFKCNVCPKAYTAKRSLLRHMKLHSDVETKENPECDIMGVDAATSFPNDDVLKSKSSKMVIEEVDINKTGEISTNSTEEHFKDDASSHSAVKSFKCKFCEKVFKSKAYMARHIHLHSNPQKYTCKYCKKTLSDSASLSRHLKIHLNIKEFICDHCNKEFRLKCDLTYHIRTHSKIGKCELCEKNFTTRSGLLKHMNMHSNPQKFTCKYCDKILANTTCLLMHEKIHLNIKEFTCDYCNREFRRKGDLILHIKMHLDGEINKCKLCEKIFRTRDALSKHANLHSNPQKYTCKFCKKTLSDSTSLSRHLKIHLNIKEFICDYCNKEFREKNSLRCHIQTHLGGKIVMDKCDLCKRLFTTSGALSTHKLHCDLQKFTCKYCNKILSGTSALFKHEKIHLNLKEFICDYCNAAFREKGTLKYHIQAHSAVRSFKCKVCKKTLISKKVLQRHMKLHSNRQKYTCKHCNKTFSTVYSLNRHEKCHLNT